MIPTQEEIKKATKVLILALKVYPEYFYNWQSNIAMSFYDEFNKNYPDDTPKVSIHQIANQAAKNFLDLLIEEE